jgi:6-phosphofructokinase 2
MERPLNDKTIECTDMKSILSLTMNPAVDMSCSVDYVFAEHKLRCGPGNYEPGGGGINVSRAIRKLGGESMAIYLAGGLTGETLGSLLEEEGVAHRAISIKGWTRENFCVLENATGQQYRYVLPGPAVSEAEWTLCLDELRDYAPSPDYLVASGSLPPGVPDDFHVRLAGVARERGMRMILDTSGPALMEALRGGVYIAKPSLRELRSWAGQELAREDEQEAAALGIIRDAGAEIVVVSLGAAGALVASKRGCERLRSPSVPVKSKVGAGDSMVAGIVLGLARDLPPLKAIRFGVAAGAAAVMSAGTQLCGREETERLFNSMAED